MRKKTCRQTILAILFFIFLSVNYIFPADNTEPPAVPLLPEVRAMGGAFTAVANDHNTIFFNPAGYGIIGDGITSVFSLGLKANIDDSAVDFYGALLSGEDMTTSSNIDKYMTCVTVSPGVAGPILFGRVGENFGFAFYDNLSVYLDTDPGAIFPKAEFHAYADVGFVGGYGTELPWGNSLYAGINLKLLLRLKSHLEGTALKVMDSVSDPSKIPLVKAIGFGSDLGLLYRPAPWFSCGIAAKDFFGTHFSSWENLTSYEQSFPNSYIKPRIAAGVALFPLESMGSESAGFRDLVMSLEYSDLLDYSSFLSNIKFGLGFKTLRFLELRGGIDGGYLTGGVGFNLKVVHIDLAYFVDERGAYPGADPVQNLMFNIAVRW
ncbi:MAG: hypothetical protein ACOC7U_09770 [Spirochaetota bacterium]